MHHLLTTSGHIGGCPWLPSCSCLIAARRLACLSLMRQTSGLAATTWIFTRSRNQYQLSVFSFSTKAKAMRTTCLLQLSPIAVSIVPLYLPIKNVPSIHRTGRQYINALTHATRQKKARSRNPGPPYKLGTMQVSVALLGFLCIIADCMWGRLSYDASYVPNLISNTFCFARQVFA